MTLATFLVGEINYDAPLRKSRCKHHVHEHPGSTMRIIHPDLSLKLTIIQVLIWL